MTDLLARIRQYPTAVAGLTRLVLMFSLAAGLDLSAEDVVGILALVEVVLTSLTHTRTRSKASLAAEASANVGNDK